MLKADIDQLNGLVGTVRDVATQVDGIDIRTNGDKITDALPGCNLGPACAQLGEFTEGAWFRVAERYRALATVVFNSANLYTTVDEQFQAAFETMDFHPKGDR